MQKNLKYGARRIETAAAGGLRGKQRAAGRRDTTIALFNRRKET
jgi:hypothetical protein